MRSKQPHHHFSLLTRVALLLPSVPIFTSGFAASRESRVHIQQPSKLYESTSGDYDVVKVDLADERDYPIYIGAGYSDDEGK
mmetsp:Transcript_22550/g.34083  ORF Transcript_22550/g.34083 Transcript_22550/m.34083 type:complete len:82 (+) Transcript_22550:103-348(+)